MILGKMPSPDAETLGAMQELECGGGETFQTNTEMPADWEKPDEA